jgi:hypothetical protein
MIILLACVLMERRRLDARKVREILEQAAALVG